MVRVIRIPDDVSEPFAEVRPAGLLQGVELAVPGARVAVGFGLSADFGGLESLFLSGLELNGAALKVEFVNFILVFRVFDVKTLGPAIRALPVGHFPPPGL
jgi:hypothetical protein